MALRWVSLDEEDHILMAFLEVNRAGNWEEFKKALLPYSAPSQNFVYADVEGNIGYIAPGKFPVRKEGHTGMVPVPGNGEWDWLGYRRPEEWPQAFNPARGYLVTANHKVTPKGFPYALTYDWAEPYRAERIEELLLAKEKLSLEDMKAIQQDQKSLLYRDFRPVLELLTPFPRGPGPGGIGFSPGTGPWPQAPRRPWSSPSGTPSSPGFPKGRWGRPTGTSPATSLRP